MPELKGLPKRIQLLQAKEKPARMRKLPEKGRSRLRKERRRLHGVKAPDQNAPAAIPYTPERGPYDGYKSRQKAG